jgi:hypothetical protein
VPAPGDYDDVEIGGMIGRGNRSTRRKPAPVPLCPPQTPHACPDANPGWRGGKPATNRLSYGTAFGTSWKWVVRFTPRSLYPHGNSPRYLLHRRLGGPQNRSGRRGQEKNLLLPGLELRTFGLPAHSQSLYRLRNPGPHTCINMFLEIIKG